MDDNATTSVKAKCAALGACVATVLEAAFLLALEGLRRTWFRFHPRVRFARLRACALTRGRPAANAKKVAVFVVYADGSIPPFTMSFIEALARRRYDTIVVSNGNINSATRSHLLEKCCWLLERVNIGRDFGAYKDGISLAYRSFQDMDRLIIANDSVYYLECGLDELIEKLDGPDDFIGISEIFEHHYHVASFLLSFGRPIVRDSVFQQFWTRYLPISTKMWAILQGEGELTKRLLDVGYRPRILFRAEDLLPKLCRLDHAEIEKAVGLFPQNIQKKLPSLVEKEPAAANGFAAAVVNEVLQRNQMHAAGFAFMKYLGLPLFKRDIVYRELYTRAQAQRIIDQMGMSVPVEIILDLGRRAPPKRRQMIRRLLYRHGYI